MHTASRRTLAVLGSPIAHSKSPALHSAAYRVLGLDWDYETRDVVSADLPEFVSSCGDQWRGLSLTMPLKHSVIPLVASVDRVAKLTGSANTILFDRATDGQRMLRGFNTDVAGIVRALQAAGLDSVREAQIIGGGATAASALVAAAELGAEHIVVSVREPDRARALEPLANTLGLTIEIRRFSMGSDTSAGLVISTLPGGVDPGISFSHRLMNSAMLFDVAYDPWPSALASGWTAAGGSVLSGLAMLVHQALLQVRVFVTGDALEPLAGEADVLSAMLGAVHLDAAGHPQAANRDVPGAVPES